MPAPYNFGEVLIRAMQAGERARRAKLEQQQEDEERKLRIDAHKQQQKELELEGRYKAFQRSRQGAQETAKGLEGQPINTLMEGVLPPGQTPDPNVPMALNPVGLPVESGRKQVAIPGSEEFGVPGYTETPRSMQEILAAQAQAELSKPYTLNQGDLRNVGTKTIASNPKPAEDHIPNSDFGYLVRQKETELGRKLTYEESAAELKKKANVGDDPTLNAIRQLTYANLMAAQQAGALSPAQLPTARAWSDDFARDTKDFVAQRGAYGRVLSAADNAAGDLSLIFSFMKILDPGSVVREQEYANAQNAAGVPDQIRNLYNRVVDGRRLNPAQRQQFTDQARDLYTTAKTGAADVKRVYDERATTQGIDPKFITFMLPDPTPMKRPAATKGGAPKVGEQRMINGQLGEWDGKGWKAAQAQ